jgi:hypothetical protein
MLLRMLRRIRKELSRYDQRCSTLKRAERSVTPASTSAAQKVRSSAGRFILCQLGRIPTTFCGQHSKSRYVAPLLPSSRGNLLLIIFF